MNLIQKPVKFISEVSQEMSKVSWPSYEQLKGSTRTVVVLCLIFTVFVFSSDTILKNIIKFIF